MKRMLPYTAAALALAAALTACAPKEPGNSSAPGSDSSVSESQQAPFVFTRENLPRLDGSTSTAPLARAMRGAGALRYLATPAGTTAVIAGSILYKICIQAALNAGLPANMMKLATAALFLLVLVLSGRKGEAIIHA